MRLKFAVRFVFKVRLEIVARLMIACSAFAWWLHLHLIICTFGFAVPLVITVRFMFACMQII